MKSKTPAVKQEIRKLGTFTVSELTTKTGTSYATCSNVVRQMLANGEVQEAGMAPKPKRGKAARLYQVTSRKTNGRPKMSSIDRMIRNAERELARTEQKLYHLRAAKQLSKRA